MNSPARIAIFLSVILGITFGLHYYLWARLVRDTQLPEPWFRVATLVLIALGVLMPLSMILGRTLPRGPVAPVMWTAYIWMGLAFLLFAVLVPVDLARGVVALVRRLSGPMPLDPERRQLLARVLGAAVGLTGAGLGAAGLFAVLRPVAVRSVQVTLAKLPPALSGYRIVQLTDVHVGPTIGRDFIEQLVARSNALEPDLVAITGDLVDGHVSELGPLVEPLRNLRARDGVFFVTGNHEYYSGADEWIAFLRTLGVTVLRNERVAIRGADGFDLAGVDDWTALGLAPGHGPDLPRALEGRDRAREVVLLAHQPKAITEATALGVGLQLSGHTHGGQIFPFNFLVGLQQPYVAGLHRRGETQVYVSRGTGYWGPPMRLGAPAEITRIELVAPSAA